MKDVCTTFCNYLQGVVLAPIANDFYTTVRDCCNCMHSTPADRHWQPVGLFFSKRNLGIFCDGHLAPLSKTLNGNDDVLEIDHLSLLKYLESNSNIQIDSTTHWIFDNAGLYHSKWSPYPLIDE